MTIPAQTPTITIAANGVSYAYDYNFEVPYQDGGTTPAVLVYTKLGPNDPVLLDPATYVISGVGVVSGGTVTYPLSGPALTSDYVVIITRNLAYSQAQVFNNTSFNPKAIEVGLDRQAMMAQQLSIGVGSGGGGTPSAGVSSFNARSGAVTLFGSDVTGALGYTPVNRAGDSMSGPLFTKPSDPSGAGLNVGVGQAPTSPVDGEIWNTTGGLFARTGGATVPLGGAGSPVTSVNGHTGIVVLGAADVGAIATTARGAVNGVASLDGSGKVPTAQLNLHTPAYFTAASQAAMLALSGAVVGDYCVRTDTGDTYVLTALPPATLANWFLFSSGSGVVSVNGNVGAVVVAPSTIGLIPSITEYGAVCDGVTDDLAAWNALVAAVNAGTVSSVSVPGLSAVSTSINPFTKGCTFVGAGPEFTGWVITGGTGNLIEFQALAITQQVNFINIGLFSSQANIGQAMKIAYAATAAAPSVNMYNVLVRGGSSGGFNRGIEMVNVCVGTFDNVFMTGYTGGGGSRPTNLLQSEWAWYNHATSGMFSVQMTWDKCGGVGWKTWFKGTDHVEGHTFHQCTLPFNGEGWNINNTGGPYFSFVDCQTDCLTGSSITLVGCNQVDIDGCALYVNEPITSTAVYIQDAVEIEVRSNNIIGNNTGGTSGVVFNNVTYGRVHDNILTAYSGYGVRFYGTSGYCNEYNNQYIYPFGASYTTWSNDSSAPNNLTNTGSQRKLTGVSATIDASSVSAQNNTAGTVPVASLPSAPSFVQIGMPVQAGEKIRISVYSICTYGGATVQLQSRIRELTHRPGSANPYQILNFAANKNNTIRIYPLSLDFDQGWVVEQYTFDIIANALDAVFSLDLAAAGASGCNFTSAQIGIEKL